ncbi:MAG: PAS domain-containing protein, partial [Cyanobacteria bacterium J06633_2]
SIFRRRLFDSGERITEFISAGCEAIFGYTTEELMDHSLWMSRVDAHDLETVVKPSWQRVRDNGRDSITYRFRHKDGDIRRIATRAIAYRDDNQQCWIITAIETAIEITDV